MVKNLSAVQETWVRSLGQEDSLQKRMATHCSILAWEIPWTVGPAGLQSMGSQTVGHIWATNIVFKKKYSFIEIILGMMINGILHFCFYASIAGM